MHGSAEAELCYYYLAILANIRDLLKTIENMGLGNAEASCRSHAGQVLSCVQSTIYLVPDPPWRPWWGPSRTGTLRPTMTTRCHSHYFSLYRWLSWRLVWIPFSKIEDNTAMTETQSWSQWISMLWNLWHMSRQRELQMYVGVIGDVRFSPRWFLNL